MWEKIKAWFKHSLTILWARIQWFIGIIGAGLVAAFSGYDWSQLTSIDLKDAFKMLAVAGVIGVVTELTRRRTL